MPPQLFNLSAEGIHILEATVHRREADIAHLIQVPKLLHHHLADAARRNLALTQAAQLVTDTRGRSFDRLTRYRPLLERFLHSGEQLFLIERLAAAVALDDGR